MNIRGFSLTLITDRLEKCYEKTSLPIFIRTARRILHEERKEDGKTIIRGIDIINALTPDSARKYAELVAAGALHVYRDGNDWEFETRSTRRKE